MELKTGDRVKIVRSQRVATLVRVRGADFYKTLNVKLNYNIKE